MKTVFRSSEIAHIWAHQRAEHGRAPSAMSFRGNDFMSYLTPIARLYPEQNAVVLATRRYSNTTTSHQTAVRRAIPGNLTVLRVDELPGYNTDPRHLVTTLLQTAEQYKASAEVTQREHPRRKSVIASHHAACMARLEWAKAISDHFGLDTACTIEGLQEIREAREKACAAREKAEAKARKARERKARENLVKWRTGESIPAHRLPDGAAYFRVHGEMVETSKGVDIPIKEARLALRFVNSKRETGWHRNGETFPIAGYQLDSVTADGVVAGCHRASWAELDRLAALLA